MLTVGVYIARTSFYRTLGPIVEAALSRADLAVRIVLAPPDPNEAKAYLTPTGDNLPSRLAGRCEVVACQTLQDVAGQLANTDAAISIVGRRAALATVAPLTRATLWAAVFDADHSVFPEHAFDDADLTFWPSHTYLAWLASMGVGDPQTMAARARAVGYVRADQLWQSSATAIRREWKLSPDRPIVLYIPDTMRLRPRFPHASDWYRHVWCVDSRGERLVRALALRRSMTGLREAWSGDASDTDLLRAVRRFCDRQGAQLVMAKRREKECAGERRFTDVELAVADAVVTEDSAYPQTLPRAIQMSDLVVCGYLSGAVLDGLAAGVPFVTVGFGDRAYRSEFLPLLVRLQEQARWPGATWEIPGETLAANFGDMSFSDFAIVPGVLDDARRRYVGPVDGQCAARVVEEIRRSVAERSGQVAVTSGHRTGPVHG